LAKLKERDHLGDLDKNERITRDCDGIGYEIANWLKVGSVEWFLTTLEVNSASHKITSLRHKRIESCEK
jgi:hypothetical protein